MECAYGGWGTVERQKGGEFMMEDPRVLYLEKQVEVLTEEVVRLSERIAKLEAQEEMLVCLNTSCVPS